MWDDLRKRVTPLREFPLDPREWGTRQMGGRLSNAADETAWRQDVRGQTVLDFTVGMSVFLLAVAFTFAFVPSLVEPFSAAEGARMVVAERGAAHLAETSFTATTSTTPSAPGVLSAVCTAGFFAGTDPADIEPDCGWTSDADDLTSELGVASHRGVNVTITQGGTIATLPDPETGAETNTDIALRGGSTPPPRASVSTGSRIVDLDGERYRLTLRVW